MDNPTIDRPKVYLAADFKRKEEIAKAHEYLTQYGHNIISTWYYTEYQDSSDPGKMQVWAKEDLDQLRQADILVLFTLDAPGRGGKDFEMGFMAARVGLDNCVVVGPTTHCFTALVRTVADTSSLHILLGEIYAEMED